MLKNVLEVLENQKKTNATRVHPDLSRQLCLYTHRRSCADVWVHV